MVDSTSAEYNFGAIDLVSAVNQSLFKALLRSELITYDSEAGYRFTDQLLKAVLNPELLKVVERPNGSMALTGLVYVGANNELVLRGLDPKLMNVIYKDISEGFKDDLRLIIRSGLFEREDMVTEQTKLYTSLKIKFRNAYLSHVSLSSTASYISRELADSFSSFKPFP